MIYPSKKHLAFWGILGILSAGFIIAVALPNALELRKAYNHNALHSLFAIITQSILLARFIRRQSVQSYLRERIIVDQIIILTSFAFPNYMPALFYSYLVSTWLHIVANLFLLGALVWLAVVLTIFHTIGIIWGIIYMRESPIILFLSLPLFLSVPLGPAIQYLRHKELKSRERQRQLESIRHLELRLLKHNFRNCSSVLCGNLELRKEHELLKMAQKATGQIDDYLDQMDAMESTIEIKDIVSRAVSFCEDQNQITIARQVEANFAVNLRVSHLLFPLVTVLNNACESGADEVGLAVENSRITVRDNGPGFDPAKIQWGYTTKPKGTGTGLVIATDLCRVANIGFEIHSHPGQGTRIIFDLNQVATG